ncbi:MAG: tripartite tricarboxylate transporter substrate binding protein [Burkholderiaceae bacterium]|jgi:tripartite-type tricarboxylate transporter receptor subunit TctC|nr:tripartite tricarboxylate transporter substrate binding protein [Burkholderiales bacterium]MCZ8103613.1 tripartite tricarboxylate transporter substrate binding protein [Burkholderiales bacterium]MCZ8337591.1 tripartite tricarboxylate transporter substrate binding protein [Burkholderiaceae bacterium]
MMAARRQLLQAAAALGAAALAPGARAQSAWPDRPIRMLVPFPPGALTDTLGRAVAERYRLAFGQPVVVENRPGAGTLVAGQQVARAAPDGYTMMVATTTTLGIAPALFANPAIRPTDLTAAAMIGNVTLFLVTRPDLPVANVKELVAELRGKPGRYNFGSPGNGTVHHLVMEMVKSRHKVFATHIPYNGSVQALSDVMSGRIDFMFIDVAIAMPQIRANRVRAIAVTGSRRSPLAPDVPAMTEFDPEIDLQAWQAIAVPNGVPPEILGRLNGELNKALATPEFREQLAQVGVEANPMTLEALAELVRRDAARWAELVKRSGARVD